MLYLILLLVAIVQCLAFVPTYTQSLLTSQHIDEPIIAKSAYDMHDNNNNNVFCRNKAIILQASPISNNNIDESVDIYKNNDIVEESVPASTEMMAVGVGEYDREEKLGLERETANVGDPQAVIDKPMNITSVLTELQAIQSQGPKKYCILGTRHCSFLHQQIVEMLAYALVLSGNHLYTSGAAGTNAAAIRGALRAFQPQLLTVVLPQSMARQTPESQELLEDVTNVVTMPQNDDMPLDVASRICNSHLLSQTDHLISFAFHESKTVLEAAQEAQKLDMLVTLLYLD